MTVEVKLSANRHKDRFKHIMSFLQKVTIRSNIFLMFLSTFQFKKKKTGIMESSAEFSTCRKYRYSLNRVWDTTAPKVLFIGLNPSKADEKTNDPTIRRCIQFAKDWNFGGFCMINLFAYCTHDPKELMKAIDPVGPENDTILQKHISNSETIILIWGNLGRFLKRNEAVLKLIKNPLCLKINKNGTPAHPLYLKSNLRPVPFSKDNENHHYKRTVTRTD